MADERENLEPTGGAQEQAPQAAPKKNSMLFLVPIILVQLVIAFFLVKMVLFPMYLDWKAQKALAAAEEKKKKEKEKKEIAFTYKISDMTTNPQLSMGTRFAVFEIVLEVPRNSDLEKLKVYDPVIRDHFIKYFRSKTVTELSDVAFMDSCKVDLKRMVEEIVPDIKVNDVFFTRFVLQ